MVAADTDPRGTSPRSPESVVGEDQIRERAEGVEAPLVVRRCESRDDVRDNPSRRKRRVSATAYNRHEAEWTAVVFEHLPCPRQENVIDDRRPGNATEQAK